MNDHEALIGLNLVPEMGGVRLKRMLAVFGSPREILAAKRECLCAVPGIGEGIAGKIKDLTEQDIGREISAAGKNGLTILTQGAPDYPENLKNIFDPPIVIYVKGRLLREDNYAVSVVGSRQASLYGLEAAERFSRDLAVLGFTVVSGMARGIDTRSHKAAIKAGGRTIAVMGSGFDHIYPAENKELAEEIARNGAVISEFPVAACPSRQNFPRRNRIISGLAFGVLVVEAARNSGALITADFALEQGRDVFALPGKVDSFNSCGTNGLIKQGAQLVCSAEDIAEALNLSSAHISRHTKNAPVNAGPAVPAGHPGVCALSCAETLLYNIISIQPVSLDDILQRTHLGIPELSPALLNLELRRMIKQLPGRQFIRREHGK